MIIGLFGDTRVRAGQEGRESRMATAVQQAMETMPGFISYKDYRADDGEELALIRFDSPGSLEAFIHDGPHGRFLDRAATVYESFWIQTAEVYREYLWADGVHAQDDLTSFFRQQRSAPPGLGSAR